MKALHMVTPVLFCLCSVAAAQPAQAQRQARDGQERFRGMDIDGDGVITRAEWRGSDQAFRRHDRNNDGVLSGDEVRDRTLDGDLTTEFRRADRNGDGALSRPEWWADAATFDRVDQNRDGRLSLAEFLGEEVRDSSSDQRSFAALDRNGNGVITANEWDGRHEDFVALDEDGDGVIARAEYGRANSPTQSAAFRSGRERGLADGRQAGREDRARSTAASGTSTVSANSKAPTPDTRPPWDRGATTSRATALVFAPAIATGSNCDSCGRSAVSYQLSALSRQPSAQLTAES